MSTRIIVIANQKGGVGKTTTTINLSHGLAQQGKKVLILDLDPQGQCATFLGMDPSPGAYYMLLAPQGDRQMVIQQIRQTGRENLSLIPGNSLTATAQTVVNAENRSVSCIKELLANLNKGETQYDYILIDTSPSVGGLQERAIWAADMVIIPTAPEFASLDGVSQIGQTLQNLAQQGWKGGLLGVLVNFYESRTNETKESIEMSKNTFGKRLLEPIHQATVLRECASEGKTIFEKAPASRSAQEYEQLVKQVIKS